MKFQHGTKRNQNRATNLPSSPHPGATVTINRVTTICTPNRAATHDTRYITPIGETWGHKRLGRVRKGNRERTGDWRCCSKMVSVLLSKIRSTLAQPDKPPCTITPLFIDSDVIGPTISQEM